VKMEWNIKSVEPHAQRFVGRSQRMKDVLILVLKVVTAKMEQFSTKESVLRDSNVPAKLEVLSSPMGKLCRIHAWNG